MREDLNHLKTVKHVKLLTSMVLNAALLVVMVVEEVLYVMLTLLKEMLRQKQNVKNVQPLVELEKESYQ